MNLSNYFWYFKSALTPRFCDEVIKYALEKKDTIALTGDYGRRNLDKKPLDKEEVRNLKYKRNSELFLETQRPILKRSVTKNASSRLCSLLSRGSQAVSYLEFKSSSLISRAPPKHSVTLSPVNSKCTPPGIVPSAR